MCLDSMPPNTRVLWGDVCLGNVALTLGSYGAMCVSAKCPWHRGLMGYSVPGQHAFFSPPSDVGFLWGAICLDSMPPTLGFYETPCVYATCPWHRVLWGGVYLSCITLTPGSYGAPREHAPDTKVLWGVMCPGCIPSLTPWSYGVSCV